jgi:hypothetical protein
MIYPRKAAMLDDVCNRSIITPSAQYQWVGGTTSECFGNLEIDHKFSFGPQLPNTQNVKQFKPDCRTGV